MKQQDITKAIAGYLGNLNPGDADKTYLRKARRIIRARLRKRMSGIRLRFMTQGSYRYRALRKKSLEHVPVSDFNQGEPQQ